GLDPHLALDALDQIDRETSCAAAGAVGHRYIGGVLGLELVSGAEQAFDPLRVLGREELERERRGVSLELVDDPHVEWGPEGLGTLAKTPSSCQARSPQQKSRHQVRFEERMHIHIVAVSGSGMGSLAGLLRELGHEVSGSDIRFDPPMGPALTRWGVRTLTGFSPEHLEPAPDLVVVGNVCRRDNPEVVRAFELGLPVTHIAGALQRFVFGESSPLVVAGTHGKTTTSALCAHLLDRAGFSPGFLIGGIPRDLPSSFRKPRGSGARNLLHTPGMRRNPPFVIEGDEYDTAFFEKTAKFLHY